METWMIYAIIASISVGFFGFAQKMKAEMPKLSDNGFIFYTYVVFLISGGVGVVLSGLSGLGDYKTMLYAFCIMFLYTIIVKTRLASLRYLSSSTYFINYRILSSLWLLFLGIFLFSETISLKEIIGVFVGFFVFYLLMEKKSNEESSKELRKGFKYLFIGSVCIAGLQSLNKDFSLGDLNIYTLIFYNGIFGIFFTLLLKKGEKISSIVKISSMKQVTFFLISGGIFSIATITNLLAYESGDLAIVYKIISYSLFIPIILSIIFYKEEVSKKKLLAFVLTILSIFLFI